MRKRDFAAMSGMPELSFVEVPFVVIDFVLHGPPNPADPASKC